MTTEQPLDKATEAVHDATEAVQATTQSIAGAIEAGRRPGGFLDELAAWRAKLPFNPSPSLFWRASCSRDADS
jgi:hypothetical protein